MELGFSQLIKLIIMHNYQDTIITGVILVRMLAAQTVLQFCTVKG